MFKFFRDFWEDWQRFKQEYDGTVSEKTVTDRIIRERQQREGKKVRGPPIADPKVREKLKQGSRWAFKGGSHYGKDILESHLAYQDAAYGISFKQEIKRLFEKFKRPVRIVSIGEGDSTFLEELRRHFGPRVELHAVDVAERRHHPEITFHNTGMEDLSRLPQNYFDIAVATRSMIYVSALPSERRNAVNQVHRILGPGGTAYIHPKPGPWYWPVWLKEWITKSGVTQVSTPLPAFIFRKAGQPQTGSETPGPEPGQPKRKNPKRKR